MDGMVNETPEVLAIIPARGGSQGIPRKNIRELGGHPLLAWSIAAAQQASFVQRVVVSTDDDEIADLARLYHAEVPFMRPAELARHETRDFPVFQHALECLDKRESYKPAIVVQLRPTSPLRPPGLVDQAIALLLADPAADSARSVTWSTQNPYKMWTMSNGVLKPLLESTIHEPYNAPRQALPSTYWQTGHIDVFRSRTIHEKQSLTGERVLPILIDSSYAIDIDATPQLQRTEEILKAGDLEVVKPQAATRPLLSTIRLLVFDFDGVFTDNRVYVDEAGVETVTCSRADGLGLERLQNFGLDAAVLSSESNGIVAARCRKLNVPVQQGLHDKAGALRDLVASKGLRLEHVAYIGNDVNDLECLQIAGVAITPADADPVARNAADLVLCRNGGHGAVREICELAIAAREQEGGEYARTETW
jgi:N-acylneuraminate cytidylyltransferase